MKTSPLSLRKPITAMTSLLLACMMIFSFIGYMRQTQNAYAAGALDIEIVAGYNLVVDSNVSSPSTYAPSVATVMGKFCNTGDATLTNVMGNIGNYNGGVSSTPGIYPARDSTTFGSEHPHLLNTGSYSFTHVGGRSGLTDASRFLGDIPAGECRSQYWHFTYPRCENTAGGAAVAPPCGSQEPVWGQTNVDSDDLWLTFDIWGTSAEAINGNTNWKMTMRNEISAMANKIQPNPDGLWFNTNTATVAPGDVITSNGVLYELGNINKGFDNDGNFSPDYNAWLQPIGDPSYDPSCFRLIRTTGTITATRSGGSPDTVIGFTDQLYFTDLPSDNTGVRGIVHYTFIALDGPCSTTLTPYQEVASGFNNEKFNGDFGSGIPPIVSTAPNVTITKTGDTTVAQPGTITYNIPVVNSGSKDAGLPLSSSFGTGIPLVISDTIPAGLTYITATASLSGDVTATILYYNTATSAWEGAEPDAHLVSAIQWWLNDSLPANGGAVNATFQAAVPGSYSGPSFIENNACTSFGNGISFDCDDTITAIQGTSTIGDFIWADLDTDGVQDGGELGIPNITVYLYWDQNDDGIIDADDILLDTQITNGSGGYDFTQLPIGDYIVSVDGNDPDMPTGYNYTTPKTHDVDITANGTNYDEADFGFGPILSLDKILTNGEVDNVGNDNLYEGQLAIYTINVINNRPGGVGATNACFSQAWATSITETSSGSSAWANPQQARYAPNGVYTISPLQGASESFEASGYSINLLGNPTLVELIIPVDVIGAPEGDLDFVVNGTAILPTTDMALLADGNLIIDITNAKGVGVPWTSAELNALTIAIDAKKSGNPSGDLGLDAVGIQVTTDETCGDTADTLNPVPVVDTYDATKLEFVTASPPVSVQASGILTWSNVGPLIAGETQPIQVTFKVLSTGGEVITNTATTTEAKYLDGRDANDATDSAPADTFETVDIGDTVWFDTNGNGSQQVGEPGLAGVVVELRLTGNTTIFYNGQTYIQNELVITTTTDANGNYLFEGVPGDTDGGTNRNDYSVTINTGASPVLTGLSSTTGGDSQDSDNLTTNDDLDRDFGYDGGSIIYGSIWHDKNANASDPTVDTNENYINGVTVQLCANANGTGCVASTTTDANGRYQFTNVSDGNYFVVVTPPGTQVAEPTGEDTKATCGTCNNASPQITVSGPEDYGGYDFGYTGANIGDTLYVDWNGDGNQNLTTEEGIPNVDVRLYSDLNGNGVVDAEDSLLETDTTDSSGNYLFTNYPAGNYLIIVDTGDPDFPSSYVQTADPDSTRDNQNSFSTDGTTNKLDVDFGYQPQGTGSIGDTVWNDADKDGIQDGDEAGIENITVTLYQDQNGNGTIDTEDAVISTTVTASGGLYDFPNLPAGNYLVDVDTTDPQLPTDGNGDRYVLSTSNDPHPVSLSNGEDYNDADFGFSPGGVIGDYLWSDNNGDGVQDLGEPPLSGVVISLTLSSGSVITTTTNVNGLYEFSGLDAGTYTVTVGTTPSGYTQTGDPDATGSCTTDPNNACDGTSVVTLTAGQVDRTRDFGYQPDVVIGDFVWLDQNGDGVQDSGEAGIGGVVVTLTLQAGGVVTTTTDSDGMYTFGAVPDGNHTVTVDTNTLPSGLTATYDQDSGTSSPNDSTAAVISGASNLTYDFGYQYLGTFSISGTVFADGTLGDGNHVDGQPGEDTYVGVPLYLWLETAPGQYVYMGETVTGGSGGYSFNNLPNNNYVVSTNANSPFLNGATYTTNSTNYPSAQVENDGQTYENVTIAGANVIDVDFGFTSSSPTAITLLGVSIGQITNQLGVWAIFASLILLTSYIVYRRKISTI